jgi:hypothetical protein
MIVVIKHSKTLLHSYHIKTLFSNPQKKKKKKKLCKKHEQTEPISTRYKQIDTLSPYNCAMVITNSGEHIY